jgi:hypothetical protein
MRFPRTRATTAWIIASLVLAGVGTRSSGQENRAKLGDERGFDGPPGLKVKVRVMVPQDQETDVLFLCFFRHKDSGDTVLATIQKFDERLGGVIASLRDRGEFRGDAMETILIEPPPGSIKARKLVLIGLGEEAQLSLETMRRAGAVALREAARLGARSAAFGAALRDQGNETLPVGDVGRSVMQGALLAFDTERRLAKEGLRSGLVLQEWVLLAGPQYFHEVAPEAGAGVAAAIASAKSRPNMPYAKR